MQNTNHIPNEEQFKIENMREIFSNFIKMRRISYKKYLKISSKVNGEKLANMG